MKNTGVCEKVSLMKMNTGRSKLKILPIRSLFIQHIKVCYVPRNVLHRVNVVVIKCQIPALLELTVSKGLTLNRLHILVVMETRQGDTELWSGMLQEPSDRMTVGTEQKAEESRQ